MNVVFISPHFPPQFQLFCLALRELGVTVLGLGDVPRDTLSAELHQSLADYAYLPNAWDQEAVQRLMGYWTWKFGRLDRVESLNEYWLPLEARIRGGFNIPGPGPAELERQRSKTGMREILQSAGIPCTDGERICTREQVLAFATRVGFPLVIKPDVGVGAAHTFRVDDPETLERLLVAPPCDAVVERFVDGRLVSFDGLTDKNGRILFCTSHVNNAGVMELVNEQRDVHFYSRRRIPTVLEDLGRRAVQAFGLKERFFHIEAFELTDGSVRVLETNLRPPGGYITDMMNFACDIDVYRLWARVLSGSTENFLYERRYHCAHVSRRKRYRYSVSNEEVVQTLGEMVMMHGHLPPIWTYAMGEYAFIIRHPDLEPLQQAVALIHAKQ